VCALRQPQQGGEKGGPQILVKLLRGFAVVWFVLAVLLIFTGMLSLWYMEGLLGLGILFEVGGDEANSQKHHERRGGPTLAGCWWVWC